MLKFRPPDIFLGALLAVAVFAMGMTFESRHALTNEGTKTGAEQSSGDIAARQSENKLTDWLLVLFNGLLFGSAILLWRANNRSAKIAEDTLTKIQRPYVFIYDVIGIRAGATEHMDGHVPYTVGNFGQTPAIIERVEARISKGDEPQEPGPETDDHPLVISPFLAAQERRDIRVQSTFWIRGILLLPDIYDANAPKFVSAKIDPDENLFVWLRIGYRGATTSGHETSACWRYDQSYGLFVRYGGDEHNYAR